MFGRRRRKLVVMEGLPQQHVLCSDAVELISQLLGVRRHDYSD